MVGTQLTVRVQAREGTKRIEASTIDSTKDLYEKIQDSFGYTCCAFALYRDRQKSLSVSSSKSKTIGQTGLRHGDILYLIPENGMNLLPSNEDDNDEVMQDIELPSTSNSKIAISAVPDLPIAERKKVPEDDVDIHLSIQDGLIPRKKDSKFCQHGENSGCIHCAPLAPYNEGYLKEQKIKHLSFHSYLKKLTSGADKGKFVALEDLSVRIKEGCKKHLPWPEGICTMCQPSAVTLNHQAYRHIDSVMFENPNIVERFISYWRKSGSQRLGLLYGNYEQHADVPLGIRARVAAIYEPPQENSRDDLKFNLNDDKLARVNEIATALGLRCVGWIFTDLIAEDTSKGTVKHIRGGHSFFMSAQECITAAYLQTLHPNPCKHSPTGYFGSKFATVIVTGDEQNQVHMEGYQVSNQCMALVRDKVLVPTKDAPELGYVKETSKDQYVPDVFFKQKDEYGNEVQRLARPLPVEYLLVDFSVSTPLEPQYTFSVKNNPFPIENRTSVNPQDFNSLGPYLSQFDRNTPFLEIACDFHFLIFIATMDVISLGEYIGPLLEAIRTGDTTKASDWAKSEHWATVEQIIASAGPGGVVANVSGGNAQGSAVNWTCPHCTYNNLGNNVNCEVCQLARDG